MTLVALILATVASAPPVLLSTGRPLEQSPLLLRAPAPLLKTRGDAAALYRKVAAATVMVRLEGSYGSGVVISNDGLVLTNHHVVEDGTREGFEVKVDITRGRLGADGLMKPTDEVLAAHVLSWDEESDVALLRIDAPPADLVSVPLATEATSPGAQVYALGHGGIGLMWSIRVCNVNAVGIKQQTAKEFAMAVSGRARATSPSTTTVVQTSCPITSGDSGGPLFNEKGEVVALNDYFAQEHDEDGRLGSPTYFHVELRHLRALAERPPPEPMQVVPLPWTGADRVVTADLDRNGKIDSVGLADGESPRALFVDGTEQPVSESLLSDKRYPGAQVMVLPGVEPLLVVGKTLLRFDNGAVADVFQLEGDSATSVPKDKWPKRWTDALTAMKPEQATRVRTVVGWVVPSLREGVSTGPVLSLASAKSISDEQVLTTVAVPTAVGASVVVDGESTVRSFEQRERLKPRLVIHLNLLTRHAQILFDPDGDGVVDRLAWFRMNEDRTLDLLQLEQRNGETWASMDGVTQLDPAWGATSPAGTQRVRALLSRVVGVERMVGSKPWPSVVPLAGEVGVRWRGGRYVLATVEGAHSVVLLARATKVQQGRLLESIASGAVKPAFAMVPSSRGDWALYDWNEDGVVDLALLASGQTVDEAWVLQPDGTHARDDQAKTLPFARWRSFKSAELRKGAKDAFRSLFRPELIEP